MSIFSGIMKNKGKIAVITQVRMSSTRLPGKVMKNILGKPMLILFLERLKMMKTINGIIVATTTEKKDDLIVKTVKEYDENIGVYRGSLNDVLDRYYQAAKEFEIDIIVRITSDCPLIDPTVSDEVVKKFTKSECDYCCNNLPPRTYPHGLDTEIFKAKKELTLTSDIAPAYTVLESHPRCLFLARYNEFGISASEIIAVSDVVITMPFTTTTIEALCAGKRAFYYDVNSRHVGDQYYFNKFPKFVAHDYKQLNEYAEYWLDEITDSDFNLFLENYVRYEIDPYLDCKALSRLRKLLMERKR